MLKNNDNNHKDPRISIEDEDFKSIYGKLREYDYFDSNLKLFTFAVLIGKYVLKKREKLEKRRGYIRYNEVVDEDEIIILKCIAVSENNDVNILKNTMDILEICEEYAKPGIHELYKWHKDNNINLDVKISKLLIKIDEENNKLNNNS